MSFDETTTEEHERRIVRCRYCNARIIWFKTDRGRPIPIDADTVEPDDLVWNWERHQAHQKTCKSDRSREELR